MDFELTDAQREYRERARTVAQQRLLPSYQARERSGRIEPELRREMGRLGLIAPELTVELGGQGADRLTAGVVTEEIARGDINVAYLQVVGSLVGQLLADNATPEVAKEWVPQICGGEEIVGIGLTAVRDGEAWVLKTAYDVITQCLLLPGQYGYRTELPIEQRLRDVLGLQIGDGTAQIMKLIIARQGLGRELAP